METQHLPRSPSRRLGWQAGPNRAGLTKTTSRGGGEEAVTVVLGAPKPRVEGLAKPRALAHQEAR